PTVPVARAFIFQGHNTVISDDFGLSVYRVEDCCTAGYKLYCTSSHRLVLNGQTPEVGDGDGVVQSDNASRGVGEVNVVTKVRIHYCISGRGYYLGWPRDVEHGHQAERGCRCGTR